MIASGTDTPDRELTAAVGATHTLERQRSENGIGQIGVQTYQNTFHRFQIGSVENGSGHGHGIEDIAGGKSKGEVGQRIALVIVLNSIGKVNGLGSIGTHGILQSDSHFLSV